MLLNPDSAIEFMRLRRAEDVLTLALIAVAAGGDGGPDQYRTAAGRLLNAAEAWKDEAAAVNGRTHRREMNAYRDLCEMATRAARAMTQLADRLEKEAPNAR